MSGHESHPRRPLRSSPRSNPRQIIERSTALLSRGLHAQALKKLTAAVAQHGENANIVTRYADALCCNGRLPDATRAYRRALAIDPSIFQAWFGLGFARLSLRAFSEAIPCFERALALEPRDPDARLHLASALFHAGEIDAAIARITRAANTNKLKRQALRKIATIIPGSPSLSNRDILDARRKWARIEERAGRLSRASKPWKNPQSVKKSVEKSAKIRIGYVSSFFQDRNWMKPVWGVINHHDRSAFEVHLFADRGNPNAQSGYHSNRSDRIHDVTNLSNDDVAARIRKARVEVLVDLNAYSAPQRLGIFMRRPARNIVGWFNSFATSGIRAFTHIIGDAEVIPPSEERFYTERVLRVAGSYLAFSVLYPVPRVVPPPCLRNGYLTFGCLAPQYKITPGVIDAFARILRGAPSARLLLKSSFLRDSANRAAVLEKFSRKGIRRERLRLEGPEEHYKFLKAYGRVDVALDTFPYNGGTTTMEALWQGVPVLAFSGDRWVGRISQSLLCAAGLREWVEPSLDAYIRRAVNLAQATETRCVLAGLRKRMRPTLSRSGACDSAQLCRGLEEHYRALSSRERAKIPSAARSR
ncbi:MAG TPA: tetratricopeptide repeat protein [Candidatus Acidoferrum sp.]|nr:tetratricopeptide repeat protein [Candidatus Acidoferrum sp.]